MFAINLDKMTAIYFSFIFDWLLYKTSSFVNLRTIATFICQKVQIIICKNTARKVVTIQKFIYLQKGNKNNK